MGDKKMNDWLKENWFRAGTLIVLLVISYAFLHNLVLIPKREASIIKECTAETRLNPFNVGRLNQEDFSNCLLKNGIIR